MKLFPILVLFFACVSQLIGQNSVTAVSIRIDSTFNHIGVHYTISGDNNHNSDLELQYKIKGASNYKVGAMSMRAYPSIVVDGSTLNMNYHGASIMFLTPNTEYDLKIILTDPDGGGETTDLVISTKALPIKGNNIKYVSPGNAGGNGTMGNPYLGLQTAANNAAPGDHFIVSSGTYSSFNFNTSGNLNNPISFESEILHGAIIDGQSTNTGVVTLGVYNDSLSNVMLDGFIIKNGKWGIDAQNTINLTIKNCMIEDVDYGIVNRRANGWEHDQYFHNNTIIGKTVWPQAGIPSERGIDIRGNNNVISYNTIQDFGDGISTDGPPYKKSYSLDIHNNEIKNIVDDIIEVDGSISNTRVYNNRGYNGRMGVSVAPVFGGPCYIFRNEFFNLETSAYKLNRGPSGLIIVNNTSVKLENGMSSNAGWQNTFFRNNVIVGSRYCFEEYGLVGGSNDDWNYDAYLSTRSGTPGNEWFKYDNIRYADVSILKSSGIIEDNAIEVGFVDFVNINLPSSYNVSYDPSQRDFNPTNGSAVIDAGQQLDNLMEPYVSDGLVDRGALEYGGEAPKYGADYTNPTCNDGIKNGDESYVDCGGSCAACNDCPYSNITISDQPIPIDLDLRTSNWIKVDGTSAHNSNIIFKAENEIELLIGFESILGSELLIDTENCN